MNRGFFPFVNHSRLSGNSRLYLAALLLSGCASVVDAPDTDEQQDAAAQDATDSQTAQDTPQPTVGAYVSCENSGGCPTTLACILGVCTSPCSGFDTTDCPRPSAGNQVVCVSDRCELACGGALVCPDGFTCAGGGCGR